MVMKGSPIADATTMEELKAYNLGAQIGTTSFNALEEVVQPDQDIAGLQLNDGRDPGSQQRTDRRATSWIARPRTSNVLIEEVKNGVVVGQFGGEGEDFGLVFDQGNTLVECVNLAIAELTPTARWRTWRSSSWANVTFPEFG